MQATGLAKYIVDKMGKKVYIFYTDYAMGQSTGASSRPRSKSSAARWSASPARRSTRRTSALVRRHQPVESRRAVPGVRRHRLAPADDQLHSFGMTKKYKLAGIDCFLLQQDLPSIAERWKGSCS